MRWDPSAYLTFGGERGRPFVDLINQIQPLEPPAKVVDLGCGPGNLTALLGARWPAADVRGSDNSADMIAKARADVAGVRFDEADARDFVPESDLDVLVSNALLQWIPSHRELLASWASAMKPGSWLAFQVPGNFDSPGHLALRDVATDPRWVDATEGILRRPVEDPSGYTALLTGLGAAVEAWETTYLHRLGTGADGRHPVLTWMSGTALRPVRAALSDADYTEFTLRLESRLADLYPITDGAVWFPFRRIFVVARPHAGRTAVIMKA